MVHFSDEHIMIFCCLNWKHSRSGCPVALGVLVDLSKVHTLLLVTV